MCLFMFYVLVHKIEDGDEDEKRERETKNLTNF